MENLTADQIRQRDEWRAAVLTADWVQEAIAAAVLADRKVARNYVISMIEPEFPDHLQPRLIIKELLRAKQIAQESAFSPLDWSHSMGPTTSTWKSTADRLGYKYVVTCVPIDS
jgi:hypothetical protein